jgi:hypothetical protein
MDPDHVPLSPPTPPQVSNFVNPATLAPTIIAISTICLAVMIPFVIIRIYSKARIVKALWWDDGQFIKLDVFPSNALQGLVYLQP